MHHVFLNGSILLIISLSSVVILREKKDSLSNIQFLYNLEFPGSLKKLIYSELLRSSSVVWNRKCPIFHTNKNFFFLYVIFALFISVRAILNHGSLSHQDSVIHFYFEISDHETLAITTVLHSPDTQIVGIQRNFLHKYTTQFEIGV